MPAFRLVSRQRKDWDVTCLAQVEMRGFRDDEASSRVIQSHEVGELFEPDTGKSHNLMTCSKLGFKFLRQIIAGFKLAGLAFIGKENCRSLAHVTGNKLLRV